VSGNEEVDFERRRDIARTYKIIRVFVKLTSRGARLFFPPIFWNFSSLLREKIANFYARVQQSPRGFAYHDTWQSARTHVKVARIIMRFPEQRGGGVFLPRLKVALPFFACARVDDGDGGL